MKSLAGLLLTAAMLVPQIVEAQSPIPVGVWQGQSSGDYILVEANGNCAARGSLNVAGTCTWSATATGGVLTMTYQWTIGPAHIAWSIRWINDTTILVNNVEQFVKRG